VKANAELQAQVDNQKKALDERRVSLEQDVCAL